VTAARAPRVGDLVQTTDQWTDRYGTRVRGLVRTIGRDYKYRRTVELILATPIGDHHRAWFDPNDLELVEAT